MFVVKSVLNSLFLFSVSASLAYADGPTTFVVSEGDGLSTPIEGEFRCKIFVVPLDQEFSLETLDRTTEVGQWIGKQTDEGWELTLMDFEVGQKPTGYPQGYLYLCVGPKK